MYFQKRRKDKLLLTNLRNSVEYRLRQKATQFIPNELPKPFDPLGGTDALPGTAEKLELLASRMERGVNLWHPDDKRFIDDFDEARRLEFLLKLEHYLS